MPSSPCNTYRGYLSQPLCLILPKYEKDISINIEENNEQANSFFYLCLLLNRAEVNISSSLKHKE
ncbi:hypothetical protein XSR1_310009 [Xenorhabdus szentirmaii DSM 16338]|uniref:Uncharacterized protein n=1 Tax=Xenorhabdus szentirmaii DSM 16338 TaxID=1427518 RepID=W1J071_9GAMM|nr:hypothetical protein XSR1_310009 [Xenorhabdus szentirmaii DSM 16338]